jgi:predicted nucleic acid-binding protein
MSSTRSDPAAPSFVAYVETNWLVAYVLPHHDACSEARGLLAAAERGDCDLRIPKVAFVEARHVIERETADHARSVGAIVSGLNAAARNAGRADLLEVARSVKAAEESYRLTNPRQELEALVTRCSRFGFQRAEEEQLSLDALRPVCAMRGADIADLYFLAAIDADRHIDSSAPAAVFSLNSNEFAVHGASTKLPRDFYSSRRLVYVDRFDLNRAQRRWTAEDLRGWLAPDAPAQDPRLREAQRLLYAIQDDRRDAAVSALRALT